MKARNNTSCKVSTKIRISRDLIRIFTNLIQDFPRLTSP